MTITAQATQLSNTLVQITWVSTDPAPAAGWKIDRTLNPPAAPLVLVTDLAGTTLLFADDLTQAGLVVGDILEYGITDVDTTTATTVLITMADLEVPFTFGLVDPLASTARYTTVDDVKQRMGITHAEQDLALLSAVVAAEVAIDQWNGRSFPDTGDNPEIPGVPEAIRTWALDASIAVWKAADAPFGQGGGDAWLGALDIAQITERIIRRHPLSLGYKVSWGVA